MPKKNEQVGQLSQPNRAAACVSIGKCEKRASITNLYPTANIGS